MSQIKNLLLLPHLKIHNANALSSPFTIGFPAMTAWLGAVHALQRKLNSCGFDDLQFLSTGVISHDFNLHTHKGVEDFVYSIIGTGNPLDKSGKRSSFIEEARCHLDVSLLIEYSGSIDNENKDYLIEKITHLLHSSMKIASGDILGFKAPTVFTIEDGNTTDIQTHTRKLMPGYALVERRDLMLASMQQGQDAIDALLDNLTIHHSCSITKSNNGEDKITWSSQRNNKGWIIPIATGFYGLTDLGKANNQRDQNILHRFAESIVTLGEFKMPHRIKSFSEILWSYEYNKTDNLYLCSQNKKTEIKSNLSSSDEKLNSLFK